MKKFWIQGEQFIWATGLSLLLMLLLTFLLLFVVTANGIGVFWPKHLSLVHLNDDETVLGEIVRKETNNGTQRLQFKIGNRDLYGLDFRWIFSDSINKWESPKEAYVLVRQEYGNFYGFLKEINFPQNNAIMSMPLDQALHASLEIISANKTKLTATDSEIAALSSRMERIERKIGKINKRGTDQGDTTFFALLAEQKTVQKKFDELVKQNEALRRDLNRNFAVFTDATGNRKEITLPDIVRAYQPNAMSFIAKATHYGRKIWELFTTEPRESNTEGGLFPAIFGTVMLVFLMSALSFPLGVMAGIYLREYAREGTLVRLVRIAVNNLAGIPSIVYGIFGLGFFVYGIGGRIDQLFFADRLPAPTFGTGGILWASLTLGLLTVPVVIVATEEALGSIPPGIREGSIALAATKFQTLKGLLLPMASPGIMTGFILAMARAAGEVAPLMITGVVKLAPALPMDGNFPFLHLNRKFMHLGFHIYDIGFQSPNVEAAMPMVYVTTLLLILIVLIMCSTAIYLRNKMRKRYALSDI